MKKLIPWIVVLMALATLLAFADVLAPDPGWRTVLYCVLALLTLGAAVGTMVVYARVSRAARERRRASSGEASD